MLRIFLNVYHGGTLAAPPVPTPFLKRSDLWIDKKEREKNYANFTDEDVAAIVKSNFSTDELKARIKRAIKDVNEYGYLSSAQLKRLQGLRFMGPVGWLIHGLYDTEDVGAVPPQIAVSRSLFLVEFNCILQF